MSDWIDKDGRRHVEVAVNRKRVHRRLPPGASARDAKRLEAEIRVALGKRITHIPGDPLLDSAMDLYLAHAKTLRSTDTATYHAERLSPWTTGYRLSDAADVAVAFVKDAREAYAAATINRSLGTLKKALSLAKRPDLAALIERLPENNARTTYLTVAQVGKIAGHASENVKAAIWIALYTGCRRGEICKIEKADVGPDTISIQAGNTKTLRRRDVPIVSALRPWLKCLPLPITWEGLKTGFQRARRDAGMEHVNFHDLRHSCATILLAHGADLFTISKILGHANSKTTERYSHMEVGPQAEALERAFGGKPHRQSHRAKPAARRKSSK